MAGKMQQLNELLSANIQQKEAEAASMDELQVSYASSSVWSELTTGG